jgi:GntR family transcriptional regulator
MSIELTDLVRGTPGYLNIASVVRGRIRSGSIAVGTQLPAISVLARQFGTTGITVRRALRSLEEEGLLRVEHGVGTFVTDWGQAYDSPVMRSFTAEMAAKAMRVTTEVLSVEGSVRYGPAQAALSLPEGAEVACVARRRWVGRAPVAVQRSYVPGGELAALSELSGDVSLYELLQRRTGRLPATASERLRAVLLSGEEAVLLGVLVGAPGWSSARTTFDGELRPLVYDEALYPACRVELRVERRAGKALLELAIDADADADSRGAQAALRAG